MDNRPIGVFDSGVGGLTSLKQLLAITPEEDIIYFGDTARVPYGGRSVQTIQHFARQDMEFLLQQNVKAVLIACGTVSSTSMNYLKRLTDIPIVGVIEPAAKRAVYKSENKKIAVLATKATIASHAYRDAILALDPEAEVYEKACPLFVPLIENGYYMDDNPVTNMVAEDYLKEIREYGCDTVILGCTHYPLIRGVVEHVLPGTHVIEAGKEAAYTLAAMLKEKELCAQEDRQGNCEYYVSDITESFKDICEIFLGKPIEKEARKHSFEQG